MVSEVGVVFRGGGFGGAIGGAGAVGRHCEVCSCFVERREL